MSQLCVRHFLPHRAAYCSLRNKQSDNPWIYYQVGGREKGAVKRDSDFTFFTPRASGAETELW